MPVLQIQLLGDFRLTYDDVDSLTSKIHARQQSLLAYLMMHREAPQSRRHLAFLFWPDTSEPQALTNLRNLLHKLRELLPDSDRYLHIDTQTIHWQPDIPCVLDVADFVTLAQSDQPVDIEKAIDLYHGELLPSCYEEWIIPHREQLQQLLFTALEKIVATQESIRNYSAAIDYAQQLLRRDPLREETYRHLMRLHALNEDRAAVMHVYHTCNTNLQSQLGLEPSTATRNYYEQLLNVQPQPASVQLPAASVHFVGRKAEWVLLQNLWSEAATKLPHLILIKGEAGIGKTRLAEELAEWVRRQGLPVLTAHCYAAQGQLAYAPLVECLQSRSTQNLEDIWLTELARLQPEILIEHPQLPTPTPITQDWQRLRLFKALSQTLPKNQPALLIHIEDLQWCDRDTLDWLHYLLQNRLAAESPVRLFVMATIRNEETGSDHPVKAFLADLQRSEQLTEIELGPLNEADTFLLAGQVAGRSLDPTWSPLLYQGSEGHPLFVVEMIRSGLGQLEHHGAEHADAMLQIMQTLPHKVKQVILERLTQLTPATLELAGLAATIGRSFNFHVLQQAMQADEAALVHGLDELWRRRIIREQGTDMYDFSHDRIREVAYSSMSLARRRLTHHRVAQALEIIYAATLGQVSGRIATHYELAGHLDQAIPYYERAAEEARRIYANADAIRDYRRALALLEGPANYSPASSARLYEKLGDLLLWVGQHEKAHEAFQKAFQTLLPTETIQSGRLYRKIGNCWRDQRCYPEALQSYEAAERALQPQRMEESEEWWQERIQVVLETLLVYYWQADFPASDRLRVAFQSVVEEHGTPQQRAVYLQDIVWIEFRRNRCVMTADMVALALEVLNTQQEIGNQAAIPSAQFSYGFALLWKGEPQAAIQPILTGLQLAEQTGDVSLQVRCLAYLTTAYRQCDRVEEVYSHGARTLEAATHAQMPEYIAMAKANQAWLAWRAGNLELSKELGRQAIELWLQLPANHASAPYQWLARFPLIAVALQEKKISWCIDEAKLLLDPTQQRLPETLETCLTQAIQAWEAHQPRLTRTLIRHSIDLAQQAHYL